MAWFPNIQNDTAQYNSGQGSFAERTIEIGGTVLAVSNIGSIRVYHGERNWVLAMIGAILIIIGLLQLEQSGSGALLIAAIGVALVVGNFLIKTQMTLSIGTCDGRFTDIVSTDKEFLGALLDAIKRKIDSNDERLMGGFDVSGRSVGI